MGKITDRHVKTYNNPSMVIIASVVGFVRIIVPPVSTVVVLIRVLGRKFKPTIEMHLTRSYNALIDGIAKE